MRSRWLMSFVVVALATALGVQMSAQQGERGGGAAPGGGGRGGGRGFNLPPLLMQTDAFPDGGIVPQKFAGRGGVQPGFKFTGAPEGTVSYAIIFHDIDVALAGRDGRRAALAGVEHPGVGRRHPRRQASRGQRSG